MQKNFRGLTLTLVAVTLALSLQLHAQQRKRGIPPPTQSQNKLQELANKAGGHFVLRYQPNAEIYPNVEELAKRSDIIVVGRTLGHRTKLSDDGNLINQEFLVRVQEVLKGKSPTGRSLVISVPGGAHRFDDGAYAIVEPLDQRPPEDRGIYIFFLKAPASGEESKPLQLASDAQGLVGLTGGRAAPSSLKANDPFVSKYGQMGAVDFLKELHKAIPRKQAGGK